jgi:hypothetical protein
MTSMLPTTIAPKPNTTPPVIAIASTVPSYRASWQNYYRLGERKDESFA